MTNALLPYNYGALPTTVNGGNKLFNKLCRRPPQYDCKLTFDLLTLKVVSESCVTWPTSVLILVFLGLSVLDLGPMYLPEIPPLPLG